MCVILKLNKNNFLYINVIIKCWLKMINIYIYIYIEIIIMKKWKMFVKKIGYYRIDKILFE